MEHVMLVLTAAPDEPRAGSCLKLARTLRQAGKDIEVLLLQDAVLLPTRRSAEGEPSFADAAKEGVQFLVLEDDLRLRGFGKDDLGDSAHLVTYRTAIRRMADGGTSVKGCF